MTVSTRRAGLIYLVAWSTVAGVGETLFGQELRSPIDALLGYVEQDVRMVVPPEMRPYKIGRLFLSVDARIPERGVIGTVGQRILERFPVMPLGGLRNSQTSPVLIVRTYQRSDAARCCDIILACLPLLDGINDPARAFLRTKLVPESLHNELSAMDTYVAVKDGDVVGLVAPAVNTPSASTFILRLNVKESAEPI